MSRQERNLLLDTELVLGGALHLLLSVLQLLPLLSRLFLNPLSKSHTHLSVANLVLFQVIKAIINIRETSGATAAKLCLHAVQHHAVRRGLVHLGKLLAESR